MADENSNDVRIRMNARIDTKANTINFEAEILNATKETTDLFIQLMETLQASTPIGSWKMKSRDSAN